MNTDRENIQNSRVAPYLLLLARNDKSKRIPNVMSYSSRVIIGSTVITGFANNAITEIMTKRWIDRFSRIGLKTNRLPMSRCSIGSSAAGRKIVKWVERESSAEKAFPLAVPRSRLASELNRQFAIAGWTRARKNLAFAGKLAVKRPDQARKTSRMVLSSNDLSISNSAR